MSRLLIYIFLFLQYTIYFISECRAVDIPETPTIQDFISVGVSNNKSLQVEMYGLRVADLEILDAKRTLFPSIQFNFSNTDGSLQPADGVSNNSNTYGFKRVEYDVQLGYPVFKSFKSRNIYKKSLLKKSIAEKKIRRRTAALQAGILDALFLYLKTFKIFNIRNDLRKEVYYYIKLIKKKRDIGLISDIEYLSSRSNGASIQYSKESTRMDLELAKFALQTEVKSTTFPKRINLKITNILQAKYILMKTIDLELLVSIVKTNSPEIKIAQLEYTAKDYDKKIARSNTQSELNISASIGQSAANYLTEALDYQNSHSIGINFKTGFGLHSIDASYANTESAPDLGVDSRNASSVYSVKANFMDQLHVKTAYHLSILEEKRAKIAVVAKEEEIVFELKKIFLNYRKSEAQLSASKTRLQYLNKEYEISKLKNTMNQMNPAQLLKTLESLSEAQTEKFESIYFYLKQITEIEKLIDMPIEDIQDYIEGTALVSPK